MSIPDSIHNISVQEFTYELPDESVAKYPLADRDQSKLLVWRNGEISDQRFYEIGQQLPENSLLVFNNTEVIRARLHFYRETGARIEIFCLEPTFPSDYSQSFSQTASCRWKCIVGNLKKWKEDELSMKLNMDGNDVTFSVRRFGTLGNSHEIEFFWDNADYSFSEMLEASGNIPIPPYLHRESEENDSNCYQTVYSKIKGSVAAPTAGLHFTEDVFESFKERGIERAELTLHVGAGTFQPVKADTIGDHEMHTEHILVRVDFLKTILKKIDRIIAVGTTSIRTLESLYWMGVKVKTNPSLDIEDLPISQWEAYLQDGNLPTASEAIESLISWMEIKGLSLLQSSTQIVILPGYEFKIVQGMVTNFHQPQSTLLLLISAFLGDDWKRIYDHALKNDYRFLSFGDSNLYLKS